MYELTDVRIIKYLCSKHGFTFSKGMGQNFITDSSVLAEIAACACEHSNGIIEIGPGFGSLTAALATAAEKVLAIELDKRLEKVLAETLAGFDNVSILWEDCMKTDLNALINEHFAGMSVSVAANLPYYITTPIIMNLIESSLPLDKIVVMVQKEVALRLCAAPGGKDYGAVTVTTQYHCRPEILRIVPAGDFFPAPKVDSAVIALNVRKEKAVKPLDEKLFFAVVKAAFSQRRKTLLNSLSAAGKFGSKEQVAEKIKAAGISPEIRAEKLSLDDFTRLSDTFFQKTE